MASISAVAAPIDVPHEIGMLQVQRLDQRREIRGFDEHGMVRRGLRIRG